MNTEDYQFLILGKMQIRRAGVDFPAGPPQLSAVLNMLLARHGEPVSREELIEGLWDDAPPATADVVVQNNISQIRKLLSNEIGESVVSRVASGYRLQLAGAAVDSVDFRSAVRRANTLRAEQKLTEAMCELRTGLGMWSAEEALVGVPGGAARRERQELGQLKSAAHESLMQLQLQTGDIDAVIEAVPRAIEAQPLNENLRGIYMVALCKTGRYSRAAREYRDLERLMQTELGIEPQPRIRELYELVRSGKFLSSSSIVSLGSDSGANECPAPEPPSRSKFDTVKLRWFLSKRRKQFFVGRARELELFRRTLAKSEASVVFLYGAGGSGKSALLECFRDEAEKVRRSAVMINAGYSSEKDIDRVISGKSLEGPVVLLIDDLPSGQGVENWLREDVLPRLHRRSLVVIANRYGPSLSWQSDLSWEGTIIPVPLYALSNSESRLLLERRKVPRRTHFEILEFSLGNPFVLNLLATVELERKYSAGGLDISRDLTDAIVSRLVGEIPCRRHREACEVAACVGLITQSILAEALPHADQYELFDWLRHQPFMKVALHGLRMEDVARNALVAELGRRRSPFLQIAAGIEGRTSES